MTTVRPIQITKVIADSCEERSDLLATEEPLEIRLGYGSLLARNKRSIAVTMRTPGHDIELAYGFLFTEGIITSLDQVVSIRHCEDVKNNLEKGNVVKTELHEDVNIDLAKLNRHFYTTSSCGVCGKSSIEAIHQQCPWKINDKNDPPIDPRLIYQLPDKLRQSQAVFEHTGGLHATGAFTMSGEFVVSREDVGRHNAFDKVVGAMLMQGKLPMRQYIVVVSGRLSFELVQKATMAGAEILVAVGAPSSLAVSLADEVGVTLIGFCRGDKFNIYTHPGRIEDL